VVSKSLNNIDYVPKVALVEVEGECTLIARLCVLLPTAKGPFTTDKQDGDVTVAFVVGGLGTVAFVVGGLGTVAFVVGGAAPVGAVVI
jgi:hypothetical protein